MKGVVCFVFVLLLTWEYATSSPRESVGLLEALLRGLEENLEDKSNTPHLLEETLEPVQIGPHHQKGPNARYHQPADQLGDDEILQTDDSSNLVAEELAADGVMRRIKRKAVQSDYFWPGGQVPYFISRQLPNAGKRAIMEAIDHWEDKTCVEFIHLETKADMLRVETQLGHSSYLNFIPGGACSSTVGRVSSGGPQSIHLHETCYEWGYGTVVHEIAHALGFHHEVKRPDRDQHLTVHQDKIQPHKTINFAKLSRSDVQYLAVPYDLTSIMQYGPDAYRKSGTEGHVLEPADKSMLPAMGQRKHLSFYDIKMANKAYKCLDECPDLPCKNGGYVGPKCSCTCPYAFKGKHCEHLEPSSTDCGGVHRGPSGEFQSPNYPSAYGDDITCRYMVQANSPNAKIHLHFEGFAVEKGDEDLCEYDQFEIRLNGPAIGGNVYCGYALHGKDLVYEGEALYLELRSDDSNSGAGFKVTYTIEDNAPGSSANDGWGPWGAFTTCSKSCGEGMMYHTRTCNKPPGGDCAPGTSLEVKGCSLAAC